MFRKAFSGEFIVPVIITNYACNRFFQMGKFEKMNNS